MGMPRPSRRIDQALLASGRALFPRAGCAGLSVRAVADHCGANPAMFHYHFRTKENFLRTLLQQMYEEMYDGLAGAVAERGPAIARLREALLSIARFARDHRETLGRVWMDALAGEPVAVDFMRANAPRHPGLLLVLLEEAERDGELRPLPPLQRFAMLVGAVVLPIVFASGLVRLALGASAYRREFVPQVASDAALRERIELALAALRPLPAAEASR
jgi:AcrR family transcriptional regulator